MMVMEANPAVHPHSHSPTGEKTLNNNNNVNSPSSNVYFVGLEFVRQYYTVMNQGPLYLHRFYSDDSSFVHGVSARDSKVVYGQQEIHKRIQSLNFRNCHAKIRQVDSHETLGNGVVIQVTGELSNNGQPMRRFMQTFVLAPQSPKRYYVRNDIFHYQDEVFCDEEGDGSSPEETAMDHEEVEENDRDEVVNNISGGPVVVPSAAGVGSNPLENVMNNLGVRTSQAGNVTQSFGQTSPIVNDMSSSGPASVATSAPATKTDSLAGKVISGAVNEVTASVPTVATSNTAGTTAVASNAEDSVTVVSVSRTVEDEVTVVASSGSAPKTYANLFKGSNAPSVTPTPVQHATSKSGTNGPSTGGPSVSVSVSDGGITSPPQVSPQPPNAGNRANEKGLPPRNPRPSGGGGFNRDRDNRQDRDRDRENKGDRDGRQNDRERERREPRERLSSRSSNPHNADTSSTDGDRGRPVNSYPDTHQLFVGNLPHTVTVAEIKEIFGEFGDVADVKIQKPAPKNVGLKVPYFAFVVFEESSSAQAALKKPKITMKMSDGTDRRLNVEEKRSRPNLGNAGGGSMYGGFNRDGMANNTGHSGSTNQNSGNAAVSGGGGHGRNYGNSYNDQQRAPPSTHTRTFRGSNRGGGNQNSGGGGDRGGRGMGGHNNNSGNNSTGGGFQGGRASPNRNYNNNKR